jgi:hypothetical protein
MRVNECDYEVGGPIGLNNKFAAVTANLVSST